MRTFNEAYNKSKKEVKEAQHALHTAQKKQLVEALKITYMIEGKMSELPITKKQAMAKKLLEYWSPETGINKAGKKFLSECVIALSPRSTNLDIKRYIQIETKKNANSVIEAFKNGNGNLVVESFQKTIEPQIKKNVKGESIRNIVWDVISESIKNA